MMKEPSTVVLVILFVLIATFLLYKNIVRKPKLSKAKKVVGKMLKNKKENESMSIFEGDKKIWEVTKKYERTDFEDNGSCVGFAIDVFQESINKTFKEYLVNYCLI
jgi:hypothetical protein